MAFTDYKSIAQVQEEYQIKYLEQDFIQNFELDPSESFREEFKFNQANIDVFSSEASRCENVIYPIIREVYKRFADQYTLWSHKSLTYDTKLSGTPDYMVSTRSELGKTVLGLPLIMVVEAKQNNFIYGWGQCLAELVAVQKLNKDEERPAYGIVTDGELWQFGKLVGDTFTKHITRITVSELDKIFSAVGYIFATQSETI